MQPEEFYKINELISGTKSPDYDIAARKLQREVVESEKEQLIQGLDQYSAKEAKQSTVHTRADIILLVSYTRWITNYLRSIEKAIWIITALLAIFVCTYFFKN
jgi:hypothetical protein